MQIESNPCEPFEVALLRRAHGALDAEGAASLDRHLLTCAACRAYAADAGASPWPTPPAAPDWGAVLAGFRTHRQAERRRALVGAGALVLVMGGAAVTLGPWAGGALALGTGLALGYHTLVVARPEARRLRALESDRAGLVERYRADLDRRLADLRGARQVVFVTGLLMVLNLVFMLAKVTRELALGRGLPDVESHLATFVTFAVVGAVMAAHGRRALPRLERERAELGE